MTTSAVKPLNTEKLEALEVRLTASNPTLANYLPDGELLHVLRCSGLLSATQVAQVISNGGWNSDIVKAREEKLLEWIKKTWA